MPVEHAATGQVPAHVPSPELVHAREETARQMAMASLKVSPAPPLTPNPLDVFATVLTMREVNHTGEGADSRSGERAGARDGTRTRISRCLKPMSLPLDHAGVRMSRIFACVTWALPGRAGETSAWPDCDWPCPVP
jgi:hypothetical protein